MSGNGVRRHPDAVLAVYDKVLNGSSAQARYIEVGAGRRVHVIELGDGPPLVLLHGTGASVLPFVPLLERLNGVRAIAVDRPGFGLSDLVDLTRERYRAAVVEWLNRLLDALGLESTALAGSSAGGTWALWYALAHPDRVRKLVLLGVSPLLPGARVPPPLRVMSIPMVGELLPRLLKPSPKQVIRLMSSIGEQKTIVNYPEQIEALVAAGSDPVASTASLAEYRALLSPFGFRRALYFRTDELRRLTMPTLLVWGDRDPVGGAEVAGATSAAIPDARLELLPAGHVPWLGHPDRTAELIASFIR